MLNRRGGGRTALGALDGVLRTLSRLPCGANAPTFRDADGLSGFPAATTGEQLNPTHVEVPAAKPHQQQQQQQQQRVTSGTEADDLCAEAVVRGLVSRGGGFDGKGEAGETVGLGAAIAGHERVVVFLLSQGVCPVSMMHGAALGGNVRLCTALLAALQPYVRIYTVGAHGLLRKGQGVAAAEQQAAEAVLGGGEGQAFREAEQDAEQTLKRASNNCLRLTCMAALPAPWQIDSHGNSVEKGCSGVDNCGGSNADSCAGGAGSGAPVGSRRLAPEARGGFKDDGRLAAAGYGSRRQSSGGGSSGTSGGGDDGGGGGGGGGIGSHVGGAGISSHVPSTDTIVSVVSAARAAADAAAIAVLAKALQSDTWRAQDVTSAPAASAAAVALAAQSVCGPWATSAASAPPAAPAAADALGCHGPCVTPSGSPRGPLSPAASPASSPSQPSTHWPHGSSASPTHTSHGPDGSSNTSSPYHPAGSASSAVSAAALATHPTANHRYLILARSLVHAWGVDPRAALSLAVWSGCGPLVSELLRAGADPRGIRHGHASFGSAAWLGRWDVVEGMYGRGDVRTALFLVALKGLTLLCNAAVCVKERVGQVGPTFWGLAALGRMWVVRWAAAVAERAWVGLRHGLWHALWWWMWG